jgi:hypothetical protein
MVSLVLHDSGFDETNLGPNTPIDVLCDSVEDERPNFVWLALTNPIRSRNHQRDIHKLEMLVKSYGGTFVIGGLSASTVEGDHFTRCNSMAELNRLTSTFIDERSVEANQSVQSFGP